MANNYYQATVSPLLPASLFTDEELDSLSCACGLTGDPDGDLIYFYADTQFCEEGETPEGDRVNCLTLLQEKLKRLPPPDFPAIAIEGAATCSRMRQGEFGGFAFYITRGEVRYSSTWQWLNEQAHGLMPVPYQPKVQLASSSFSVLLLYPDYLDDTGYETFYALVNASDQESAVAAARKQAAEAQSTEIDDPTDFHPLLVTEGHHASLPLFDK